MFCFITYSSMDKRLYFFWPKCIVCYYCFIWKAEQIINHYIYYLSFNVLQRITIEQCYFIFNGIAVVRLLSFKMFVMALDGFPENICGYVLVKSSRRLSEHFARKFLSLFTQESWYKSSFICELNKIMFHMYNKLFSKSNTTNVLILLL